MVPGRIIFTTLLVITLSNLVQAADYQSNWPANLERVWIGPDYWGDRLQDWRLADGRVECVEAARRYPMRVLHLLTYELAEAEGNLRMSVRTGALDPGQGGEETWTGFLIGSGGPGVDYRITALAHHKPGEDGGIIAAIDGTGKVILRDFSGSTLGENLWSINGPLNLGIVPIIKPAKTGGEGFQPSSFRDVILTLVVTPESRGYRIYLAAHDAATQTLISEAGYRGVAAKQLDGGLALVSHLAPQNGTRGYWFRDWSIAGSKVVHHPERQFGPVLCTQYTLSGGVLKLTAQMPPLGRDDNPQAELQLEKNGAWKSAASSRLKSNSYTFPFRVDNWDGSEQRQYRVVYDLHTGLNARETFYFEGTIQKEPTDKNTFVLAAFTGHKIFTGVLKWNSNGIWFPHNELVVAVRSHQPDLLFFSGDQIYEGDLTGAQREPLEKALLDYLDKWYRWCWAFRDLARAIPCICIPDDHDVYHGNLWGAGGRHAVTADDGGYIMDPLFVNMVQETQTSHLPDPYDPTPVEQGIGVYYTALNYGGISFAILEDRKWKSSPTVAVTKGKFVNGWPQNPNFNAATESDVPGAELLGPRQIEFLHQWSQDWWHETWFKVALSQTLFANVATLPRGATLDSVLPQTPFILPDVYPTDWNLAVDADSNGWPQSARNQALYELRRGLALHVSGDQHLGSTVQYGIDGWRDAGYSLCVPSIANTWPRRWYPPQPGKNWKAGDPPYTGNFLDGFGNHMTVFAVSNPVISGHEPAALYDRAPGYGIARFDKARQTITLEVWPRWEDPTQPAAKPYPGWPITISVFENDGRAAAAYLPRLHIQGLENPVIQVVEEQSGEVLYTLRVRGTEFRPKVFQPGTYRVRIGNGDAWLKTIEGVTALAPDQEKVMEIEVP